MTIHATFAAFCYFELKACRRSRLAVVRSRFERNKENSLRGNHESSSENFLCFGNFDFRTILSSRAAYGAAALLFRRGHKEVINVKKKFLILHDWNSELILILALTFALPFAFNKFWRRNLKKRSSYYFSDFYL